MFVMRNVKLLRKWHDCSVSDHLHDDSMVSRNVEEYSIKSDRKLTDETQKGSACNQVCAYKEIN